MLALEPPCNTVCCTENKSLSWASVFVHKACDPRYAGVFSGLCLSSGLSHCWHSVSCSVTKTRKRGILFSRRVFQPLPLPSSAWSLGSLIYLWGFASRSSESARLIAKHFKFYHLCIPPDFLYLTVSRRTKLDVFCFRIWIIQKRIWIIFHVLMEN